MMKPTLEGIERADTNTGAGDTNSTSDSFDNFERKTGLVFWRAAIRIRPFV